MEEEILKYVYTNSKTGSWVDVLEYLLEKYPSTTDRTFLKHIIEVLGYLREQKFIGVSQTHYASLGNMVTNPDAPFGSGEQEFYDLACMKRRKEKPGSEMDGIMIKILYEGRKEVESWVLKEQIQSVNESLIATNNSTKSLNEQTVNFYKKQSEFLDKQEKYNTIQKKLTWAIVISSIIYTIVTALQYTLPLYRQYPIQPVKQVKLMLENPHLSDSSKVHALKEILENP